MASEDPSNPIGAGAGVNADPLSFMTIPPARNAYMREAASSWKDKVTEAQMLKVLANSYRENPTLMGGILQMDLESRFENIISGWEPESKFWDAVIELVGQEKYETIKEQFVRLKNSNPTEFKKLQNILRKLKMNQTIFMSELRDNFDDFRLEQLLLDLYSTKVRRGKQFGGKTRKVTRRKSGKSGTMKRRKSGKSKKSKKSGKSRKGK